MSRSKENPKGTTLNEDRIAKVKPLEPWPDPPIKNSPGQQPGSKPSVPPTGKSSKKPAKKGCNL